LRNSHLLPLVVVSPRYFAKQIGWGGQNSLSLIINACTEIAAWQAVTQRLSGFEQQLLAIHQSKRAPRQINIRRGDIGVAVKEIDLDLPDGTSLLRDVAFASARGEALLIEGPTVRERVPCCERWPAVYFRKRVCLKNRE
jgi:vitamin B12/bleomycin/antimicrobial peptide transport system ATP-binding/permease protein